MNKIKALVLGLALGSASLSVNSSQSMSDVFDQINAYGNVAGGAAIQGQTMNYYTGGSAFVRIPKNTYNLASLTPPSVSAGCGGINLFGGSFSFINAQELTQLLRAIAQNALGLLFQLGLNAISQPLSSLLTTWSAKLQEMNSLLKQL